MKCNRHQKQNSTLGETGIKSTEQEDTQLVSNNEMADI